MTCPNRIDHDQENTGPLCGDEGRVCSDCRKQDRQEVLGRGRWLNASPRTCQLCWRATPWHEMTSIGVQRTEDETGMYETEMRNCMCGATYAVERLVSAPGTIPRPECDHYWLTRRGGRCAHCGQYFTGR